MRELELRQKFRKRIYSLPALLLLSLLTVVLIRAGYSIWMTERESAKEVDILREEVSILAKREGFLKGSIDKLNTDEGVEEEIKSKFNVARPGERVAVIVDPLETEATSTPLIRPWYKRIWDAIIGTNE